jgi:POLQ-like helicase
MRPERASRRLQGITHAKSRMYEFNVPEELQEIQLGKSDPSALFPLVIGILGDEAGRIGSLALEEQTERRRIVPEKMRSLSVFPQPFFMLM